MRIEQLEYLAAVTRHGSLRRASVALHVSQPALSEALVKLEKELGATLLDRRRSGARISRRGQDLMPLMTEVLDAVDRLRQAAGEAALAPRTVRLGTVNAASSSVLVPAVKEFRERHPATDVEVLSTQQAEIFAGLAEGSLDLGLVNVLPGDDVAPGLTWHELVAGHAVVCMRPEHPLAAQGAVSVDDLRRHPFIAMRSGYLMHRFAHRLFGGRLPARSYSTDGAEMGKLMAAEGLGLTLLPDYSVEGDPLTLTGLLTYRRLVDDDTPLRLLMVVRELSVTPAALQALQSSLARHAAEYRPAVPATSRIA